MKNNNLNTLILSLCPMFFLYGCANRKVYYPETSEASTLILVISIILAIEVLVTIAFHASRNPDFSAAFIVNPLSTLFGGFIFGYIIFAEWFFYFLEWALQSWAGKIILALISFIGGIFSLESALSLTVTNGVFFKSTLVSKWVLIPALVGGLFQIGILLKTAGPDTVTES